MEPELYRETVFELLARVGKGVSSPKRLLLLDILAQGPRTVEVLAHEAGMSVANTSQHLRVLQRARLVESKKRALYVTYRVAGEEVVGFVRSVQQLAEQRVTEIERLTKDFHSSRKGMKVVDRNTLLHRVRDGKMTVVDVRPREEYTAGHIPGAVSVPLHQLTDHLKTLRKNREIIAYGRGPYCVLAMKAVEMLRKRGYQSVRLQEGVTDWKAHGYKITVGDRE